MLQYLRVLCLHGRHQTADIFQDRLSKLRRSSVELDFVFVDGPADVLGEHGDPLKGWRKEGDKDWAPVEQALLKAFHELMRCLKRWLMEKMASILDRGGLPLPPDPRIASAFGNTDGEIFDRKMFRSKIFSTKKKIDRKFCRSNFFRPKNFSAEQFFDRKIF